MQVYPKIETLLDDIIKIASKYNIAHTEETAFPKQITLRYTQWEQGILIRNKLNDLRSNYNNLKVQWDYKKMSIIVTL